MTNKIKIIFMILIIILLITITEIIPVKASNLESFDYLIKNCQVINDNNANQCSYFTNQELKNYYWDVEREKTIRFYNERKIENDK